MAVVIVMTMMMMMRQYDANQLFSNSLPQIWHRYGNALNSQQLWTDELGCVLQYSHYVLPAFILIISF